MSDDKKLKTQERRGSDEQLSLNDDRRVKVLSPGRLVAKRFFRNRLAMVGLVMLISMFLFSFLGGVLTPHGQAEQFYTDTLQKKEYVAATQNEDFRYYIPEDCEFSTLYQAQFLRNLNKGEKEGLTEMEYSYKDTDFRYVKEGADLYAIYTGDQLTAVAYKDVVIAADNTEELPFNAKHEALKAYTGGLGAFSADGVDYTLDEHGNIFAADGTELAYISRFIVRAKENGIVITRDFTERLEEALQTDAAEFHYTDDDGTQYTYYITYDGTQKVWSVREEKLTRVYDMYAAPSLDHPLGLDKNGMDMLTRLMYGGRVSLYIGFIVIFIETFIGVILGGISGYFGGWIDNVIMRIVDIFYCIPSMPIIIILGSAMDNARVDPSLRMLYLMLILGFLGWAGIARLVRGQILSLREQEFMTATEACGISVSHRIFKHLVPNVIPQLIVSCTMGLGSVIITEATLSFLGLGVKFPFASWGNIISDVNDSYVMTNYWYIWIPAGVCLLITVLGFNFVGDGLRDAFDPKMKR